MDTGRTRSWRRHWPVVALLAVTGLGWADRGHAAPPPTPDARWKPVAHGRLDALRGGWVLPSGLLLSFGIERVAYVNGVLVSSVRLEVPDISRITPQQAEQLARVQETRLLQMGPGNAFSAGAGAGLVIQNAVDNQSIQVHSTIDAAVGSLGLLQAINTTDALGDAGRRAVGGP